MNSNPRIVCLGEILWDLLPSGPQLGGAPSNLACHVAGLGGRAAMVSRVGDDDLGRSALAILGDRGVELHAVSIDAEAPTGTGAVQVAADGQPRFTLHENVAWDRLVPNEASLRVVSEADVLCFGSLGQRTVAARRAIQALVAGAPEKCSIVFDINLRAPFYEVSTLATSLEVSHVLKLNDDELDVVSGMFGLVGSVEGRVEDLGRRFGLAEVLLTLGAKGSRLWSGGTWTDEPGRSVTVHDTVGAGDALTAGYVLGRKRGWDPAVTLRRASDVAAYVCTRAGATPELPAALTEPYRA